MNKEQKIWFIIMAISGMIFLLLMYLSFCDIRFKYGTLAVIISFAAAYVGMIMMTLTKYSTTREILSSLRKNIVEW